ncbi:LysR family transcriptional regulator [Devosia sp. 1566]|uniref:LysR family transcriptional regulator n=1 Tax=Devosia sp. 1566 TaxID=2499144 RepID=UPI000FD9CFC9|nr:LysR family transcriptional regulator [Devosia sp. 1566]
MDDKQAIKPGAKTGSKARGRARATSAAQPRTGDLTLHQLRIFWAVARSTTLTNAAKQLGLTQPSLSQQLAKLEANVGTLLFHRRSNEMELTEAGQYLLPKAEQVLRSITELEDGLGQFGAGQRLTLRLAGINSVLRVVLPRAVGALQGQFPDLEFDLLESAPGEILDLLYSRRVTIGLLAANSVAQAGVGFVQVPLLEDPYVLVVPKGLELDGVSDPQAQLPAEGWRLLNQAIQFSFGSRHASRVADWYARLLPEHRVVAQCRSFETAIGLVRAGAGVCLAPALASVGIDGVPSDVTLYRVQAPPRRIVALVPSQYRRVEPYAAMLEALQASAAGYVAPPIAATPPWLALDRAEEF